MPQNYLNACPVPQPRVLGMVGQIYLKLNPKEDLSPGITGAMQSAHPNNLDMWRPAAVNTLLFTTHSPIQIIYFNEISTEVGTIQ